MPEHRLVGAFDLALPDWGWTAEDRQATERLAASLRSHGQTLPLLVRRPDGTSLEVVDGRKRLVLLRTLGVDKVSVVDVGAISRLQAMALALSMQAAADVDYARLARCVWELVASGDWTTSGLANTTPYTREQLEHFLTLCSFDWSRFSESPDGQGGLDFAALVGDPEPETVTPAPAPKAPRVLRPGENVADAEAHHRLHGDMDGPVCMLSRCALHYPEGAAPEPPAPPAAPPPATSQDAKAQIQLGLF